MKLLLCGGVVGLDCENRVLLTTTLPIISPEILGGPEATGCPIISKDLTDVTPVLMNAL